MALADYYHRAAVAASQVIAGFDQQKFRDALEGTCVGLAVDHQASATREGRALADLTVRLLARLYPTIAVTPGPGAEALATELTALAKVINPDIATARHAPLGITIGPDAPTFDHTIFAGSDGWTARLSSRSHQSVGGTAIPFGAGAAACFAAAAVFRIALLGETNVLAEDITVSCLDGIDPIPVPDVPQDGWRLPEPTVLVGCGAVGQAAVWALSRSPLRGELHLADHEAVDLSNMQRYVLTTRADENATKTTLAARTPTDGLVLVGHPGEWSDFTVRNGYCSEIALVAVDSAWARRAVQSSLPRWIANSWTRPGDLGVSTHAFGSDACVACLYLPNGPTPSQDAVVAAALGISPLVDEVRALLYTNEPVPPTMLNAIAAALDIEREALESFEGQPIRKLYVEGICGGDVLPLGRAGEPRQDVHVPLAHQSALAGVLLAARLTRKAAGLDPERTEITSFDVLRDPGQLPTRPAAKDPRGICICQDRHYRAVYRAKWTDTPKW